jgi:hypothetical protein
MAAELTVAVWRSCTASSFTANAPTNQLRLDSFGVVGLSA